MGKKMVWKSNFKMCFLNPVVIWVFLLEANLKCIWTLGLHYTSNFLKSAGPANGSQYHQAASSEKLQVLCKGKKDF